MTSAAQHKRHNYHDIKFTCDPNLETYHLHISEIINLEY